MLAWWAYTWLRHFFGSFLLEHTHSLNKVSDALSISIAVWDESPSCFKFYHNKLGRLLHFNTVSMQILASAPLTTSLSRDRNNKTETKKEIAATIIIQLVFCVATKKSAPLHFPMLSIYFFTIIKSYFFPLFPRKRRWKCTKGDSPPPPPFFSSYTKEQNFYLILFLCYYFFVIEYPLALGGFRIKDDISDRDMAKEAPLIFLPFVISNTISLLSFFVIHF